MTDKLSRLPDKDLFRVDEAARYVCRTKRTVYNWCRDGNLRYVRVQNRGILIPRDALVEVIRLSSDCYV